VSCFDPDRIEIVSITDVGRQRASNQDTYAEGRATSGARWAMVADGMGGHAGGETASRVAVETVDRVIASSADSPDAALRVAFEEANRTIHEQARHDASLAGMGTTGVAILFCADGTGYTANVGDSRAYRLRGDAFEQITQDHSLVAELQRRGVLTEEEALAQPRRNEVLRSLGVEADVDVDLRELELRPGDRYLLCSDGLSGVLRDPEIASVVREEAPAEALRTLVDRVNERGGPDNVTVQIAVLPEEDGDRPFSARVLPVALAAVALALGAAWLAGIFSANS
jgi:protein phosphatase